MDLIPPLPPEFFQLPTAAQVRAARARVAQLAASLGWLAAPPPEESLSALLRALAVAAGPEALQLLSRAFQLHPDTMEGLLDPLDDAFTAFHVEPAGLVATAKDIGLTYPRLIALMLRDAARVALTDGESAGYPGDLDAVPVRQAWNVMEGRPADPAFPPFETIPGDRRYEAWRRARLPGNE